jgi:hypothetical protein
MLEPRRHGGHGEKRETTTWILESGVGVLRALRVSVVTRF